MCLSDGLLSPEPHPQEAHPPPQHQAEHPPRVPHAQGPHPRPTDLHGAVRGGLHRDQPLCVLRQVRQRPRRPMVLLRQYGRQKRFTTIYNLDYVDLGSFYTILLLSGSI